MLIELIFLEKAIFDLGDIKIYKNSYVKNSGTNFINGLKLDLEKLKIYPKLGIHIEFNSFRLVFKKNFYIYYRFEDNKIKIVRIFNVKKNIKKIN
jgi:hypothetical protein